ncbi:MAG: PQQ-binding-like beta-propeller repeat protein [Rhizomicrobium sp.]
MIIDSEQNLPGSFSGLGGTLKNAARLDAAGVTVVFQPQGGTAHYARTITQIAGNAVANGMKWDHALAAITRNPAEVWGIADTYGTLDPGVLAFDAKSCGQSTCGELWKGMTGDPIVSSSPTVVDGKIYVGSSDGGQSTAWLYVYGLSQ